MDYNDIPLFGKVKFVFVCTGIKHIVFVINKTYRICYKFYFWRGLQYAHL